MDDVFEVVPGKSERHLTYCRPCEAQWGFVAIVEHARAKLFAGVSAGSCQRLLNRRLFCTSVYSLD